MSIEVENPSEVSLKLDESNSTLDVSAKGGPSGETKRQYKLQLEFYGKVKEEDSKQSIEPRFIFLMIMKQEAGPHWPRLTKEKDFLHKKFVRTDWTRYMDEDDEEEQEKGGDASAGGLDLSQLGNMSDISEALNAAGAGGGAAGDADDKGGGDDDDSDDELPDLCVPSIFSSFALEETL